jgi:DNA primase
MNSFEAKKLNLPEIMSRLGHEPISIKKGGNEYWYNSPFRAEKDASFHTSYLGGKWIWNDFGDSGGTVIDFILRHENMTMVSDALKFLDDMYGNVGDKLKYKVVLQMRTFILIPFFLLFKIVMTEKVFDCTNMIF